MSEYKKNRDYQKLWENIKNMRCTNNYEGISINTREY